MIFAENVRVHAANQYGGLILRAKAARLKSDPDDSQVSIVITPQLLTEIVNHLPEAQAYARRCRQSSRNHR